MNALDCNFLYSPFFVYYFHILKAEETVPLKRHNDLCHFFLVFIIVFISKKDFRAI